MTFRIAALALLTAILAARTEAPIRFTDVTAQAKLSFRQSYGDHHMDNIVEGTGTGACAFDYDGDGFVDLFFANGKWTRGVSDNEGRDLRGKLFNALFRNNGDGTFANVTQKAGIAGARFTSGCSAADYNNDGHLDIYLLNYGENELFRNNGDGTFTEVGKAAGLNDARWSLSAVWFDFNNDGWLDVYVGNYLLYDDGKFRDFYPAQGYPGPLSYSGQPNALYRNNGDGTFSDVTREMGMWFPGGRAMSVTASDFNNDGKLEVLSANDAMENYYFEMTPKGVYAERALDLNIAFSEDGQGVAHMGPVVGDINRDGRLDIFIPDLNYCSLLIQNPDGAGFTYRSRESGVAEVMGQYAGWAAMLFDLDHDGWLDIFTVHGNAHHEYPQEDSIIRNLGNGKFEDVSERAGPYFREKYVGRGGTGLDFDNDGDIDLAVVNLNSEARLLRNDSPRGHNWITVVPRLKFPTGTRDAHGARVTVTAGKLRMIEDVVPTRGYLGQQDARVNFGLGAADKADIEIRWPDGSTEEHPGVAVNRIVTFVREARAK